jgi:hypothetical protein
MKATVPKTNFCLKRMVEEAENVEVEIAQVFAVFTD